MRSTQFMRFPFTISIIITNLTTINIHMLYCIPRFFGIKPHV